MRKLMRIAGVGLVCLSILAPSVAMAKDGDVVRRGDCNSTSIWKLKLGPRDPAVIQMAFEVDQNVAGDVWVVRVRHNGEMVIRSRHTTEAPSGSFTVRDRFPDAPGRDIVKAMARNVRTGEVCFGRAVLRG